MKRIFLFGKSNPENNRNVLSLLRNLINGILTAFYARRSNKRLEIEKLRKEIARRNQYRSLLGGRPMTRKEITTLRTRVIE